MYKFKGTINGVEYTNRNEFFDALKEAKSDGNIKVTLSEEQSEEEINKGTQESLRKVLEEENPDNIKENKPSNKNQYKSYENLFDTLGDLFISFLKTQNNELYKKLIDDSNKYELPKDTANTNYFNEILTKYMFKETTYVFNGGEEDKIQLRRFHNLLNARHKEIDKENPVFNKSQKKVIYNKILSEMTRLKKQIGKIEDSQIVTDHQLAGLERVINSYKEISYPVPENIYSAYEEQKTNFNILLNRKEYYSLLSDYYENIITYFY